MLGVPRAWEVTDGSASVIVAVVDDGIRFDHVSMTDVLTNDGYDFVRDPGVTIPHCAGGSISFTGDGNGPDPDPTVPSAYTFVPGPNCATGPNDFGGHGLHVAGTIAAAASGVVGVAPRVRIRPVRVLGTTGQGTNYDVAQGILYAAGLPADNGAGGVVQAPSAARVINMSLGSTFNDPVITGAIVQAHAAGALLVASSGNSGNSVPHFPAALAETLSVTALGPDFLLAPYATWGTSVDVAAPGGSISVYGGFGGGVWSAWWSFTESASYIAALHGTSMAAPHVSGVAALLFSANPGMTATQVKARIIGTARDLGTAGEDDFFGAGLVDAFLALTNGAGFPSALRVSLFHATTGAKLGDVEAESDRSFQFSGLADGTYLVYAGTDDRGDGITGRPGFLWGARGGTQQPAPVTIQGTGVQDGSLTAGLPIEAEPNNTLPLAHPLPVGGYMYGAIGSPGDVDHYRVLVPAPGIYTFETGGATGMCGFGLEVNTRLDLLDTLGGVLATNDDVDAAEERYCSTITTSLAPGTYTLRVRAFSTGFTGNYSIRAY
jgi:serine protease